jgi:DNA-directed RNA polymerase subunit RPC12/RpoP
MEIRCANCSAKINLERDDPFLKCPFCDSTLFLDRAQTFKRFQLPPSVSEARARSGLIEELSRREMPRLPILEMKGLLLPFWGVRGKESGDTFPAFSPLPAALHGFRLPPAGALVSAEPPDGFEPIPCSDNTSALWQNHPDAGAFSLYLVPFYRISFGTEKASYTAWLDAVVGSVHLEQTPPPLSGRITRRFWSALTLLFCLFGAEAFLLEGWIALVVVAATAAACYPALRGFLEKEES